jgi:hypothetical protein
MTLETKLKPLGKHFAERLDVVRPTLTLADDTKTAYNKAVYGEPRVVQVWPTVSVQPQSKRRLMNEGASRKFRIEFIIDLILYHGKVTDTLSIQEETHERAERLEDWVMTSTKWNYVDEADAGLHKVIFGFVTEVDHPIVVAPGQELWSASRLRLQGLSEEVF